MILVQISDVVDYINGLLPEWELERLDEQLDKYAPGLKACFRLITIMMLCVLPLFIVITLLFWVIIVLPYNLIRGYSARKNISDKSDSI